MHTVPQNLSTMPGNRRWSHKSQWLPKSPTSLLDSLHFNNNDTENTRQNIPLWAKQNRLPTLQWLETDTLCHCDSAHPHKDSVHSWSGSYTLNKQTNKQTKQTHTWTGSLPNAGVAKPVTSHSWWVPHEILFIIHRPSPILPHTSETPKLSI